MTSTAFEQVAALLPKLTAQELSEVRARAGILCQAGGAKAPTSSAANASPSAEAAEDADVHLVLGEIAGQMQREGIEFANPEMLKRTNNFISFAAKVPATMRYFRKVTTNRVKLRALIRVSIRFLYKDMAKMNVSCSTRTMMNHWHRVPAVIDNNFPGYAKAGLLGLILHEGSSSARYVQEITQRESD